MTCTLTPYQTGVPNTATPTVTPTQYIPGGNTLTPVATFTFTPTQGAGNTLTTHFTKTVTTTPTVYIKCPTHDAPIVVRQNVIRPSENKPVIFGVHLDRSQHVAIRIYTQHGKLIKVLEDRQVDAGTFEAAWNGANQNGSVVRSGIYLVEIQTDTFTDKRKVIVIR